MINFCGKFWPLGPTSFFSALLERLDKGIGGVLAPDFSSSRNGSARDVMIKQQKYYTFQWVRFQPFGDAYNYTHHPLPTYHCFADRCVLHGSPEFSRAAGFFRVKNGFASKLHCGGHAWHWAYSRMPKLFKMFSLFQLLLKFACARISYITKWNKVENQIISCPGLPRDPERRRGDLCEVGNYPWAWNDE